MALVIKSALLCEDVREEKTNKFIVIGIFPVDIVIPQVPADISVNFYLELLTTPGDKRTLFIRASGPGDHSAIIKMEFQTNGDVAALYGPRMSIRVEKEGTFKLEFGETEDRYDLALERAIRIGPIASAPLFLQSPPAAPTSS